MEGIRIVNRRRTIGSFYSPEDYAACLVRWALDGKPGKILDPSFGGCAFLRVAIRELRAVGAEHPTGSVFGTDIDSETADWAAQLVEQGVPTSNLLADDFLALTPGSELPTVAAVVGNPPYVRHHWMTPSATAVASRAMDRAGTALSGRANLWAYFVIHASRFVEPGGRLAMLLPGSVLAADYASKVRDDLTRSFGHVALVRVHDRLFEDAAEETVVLLASAAGQACSGIAVADVRDLHELQSYLDASPVHASGEGVRVGWSQATLSRLDRPGRALFERLLDQPEVQTIGDLAQVRLGTVTGANAFFLCSVNEVARLGLQTRAIPVVGRSAWLQTTVIDDLQFDVLARSGEKTRLLVIPADFAIDRRTRLGRRISDAEREGIHLRHHTRRVPWWSLPGPRVPDAFLPYMSGAFKGIAENRAAATSTNTVHQIDWKPETEFDVAAGAALSSWSTLTAISAELAGRASGGGLLKVEIADARQLLIVPLELEKSAQDKAMPSPSETRAAADAQMAAQLNLGSQDLRTLRENLVRLAYRRMPRRKTVDRNHTVRSSNLQPMPS